MTKASYRQYLAELLGVAMIVGAVLGSGHMVQRLEANSSVGLILLAMAAGGVLFLAIAIFQPISGAHLNPAVTLVMWLQKSIGSRDALFYVMAQFLGGFLGAVTANLMYEKPLLAENLTARAGYGQLAGEFIATLGLVLGVLLLVHFEKTSLVAGAITLWIVAGHIFTSSTSFANPAVTFGRAFSDAVSGISWASVPAFWLMQILAGIVALGVFRVLTSTKMEK